MPKHLSAGPESAGPDDVLVLIVTEGPEAPAPGERLACTPDGVTFGRSPQCAHLLPDPRISRQHARIERHAGTWCLTDLASTSGTMLNGVPLEPHAPAPVALGDGVRLGPWRLRVGGPGQRARARDEGSHATLSTEGTHATAIAPSRRLEVLSGCIGAMSRVRGERSLALEALRGAMVGTGARRGAALSPPEEGEGAPVIVALEMQNGVLVETDGGSLRVPKSLVMGAMEGRTSAVDSSAPIQDISVSIVEQRIQTALCAPVTIDERVVAMLYFDSRSDEAPIRDGASFVEDIAQVLSLSLAYDARGELERRQATLRADIERARALRSVLAPPEVVEAGRYRVSHTMRAGAFVSGDLVDVVPAGDGSHAVLFGDASGHGVGAAMLTALAQSYLHSELTHHLPLAGGGLSRAIEHANAFIASRETGGAFVTLWACVLGDDGLLAYVDAGHGHWLIVRGDGTVEGAGETTGPPLGVLERIEYPERETTLGVGDRLVLYTDGVSECTDASGVELGSAGVVRALEHSFSGASDVEGILAMVDACPGGAQDDATVLSIERLS